MRDENVTPEAKEFAEAIHGLLQELIDEGEKNTTILYVHGLGSTKDSSTAAALRKFFPKYTVCSFDVPFDPDEAVKEVLKQAEENNAYAVVGTSLGAFYASFVPNTPKILINPALDPSKELEKFFGKHEYFGVREDGVQTYTVDETYLAKLAALEKEYAESVYNEDMKEDTYGLFSDGDDVVNDREKFASLFGDKYSTGDGGHRLTEDNVKNDLVPLVHKIIGKYYYGTED